MQPGLATVGTGPGRLRPDQTYAGASRVVVHPVARRVELVQVPAREELRGAVRALGDTDLPAVGQRRPPRQRRRRRLRLRVDRGARAEHVTALERTSGVPAEPAERERRGTAQEVGYVQATSDRDVGPQPRPVGAAERQRRPRGELDRLPLRGRDAVDADRHGGTGHADDGGIGEDQRRPHGRRPALRQRHRDLETRGTPVVADGQVGLGEGDRVEGTRRRDADLPVAHPAGKVLDGREHTRIEHVDARIGIPTAARLGTLGQGRGRVRGGAELGVRRHRAQRRDVGDDPVDPSPGQR